MVDLRSAANAVRQFSGSDCSRALVVYLDVLESRYKDALVEVSESELKKTQSVIKQIAAIRQILNGVEHIDGIV